MKQHLTGTLTALLVLLAAPAARAAVTPPPAGKAKEVRFPAFSEKTLANGLKVIAVEQHEQPLVSVQLVVPAGRLYEPATQPGIAGATASLLRQGTASRTSQQIAAAIDEVGGSLGAGASADTADASVRVTSDQVSLGLTLLSDIVLHPAFPKDEVERWRRQTLSSLQLRDSSADSLADEAFDRVLFGSHPYGGPASGTTATVQALTRDDLIAFHKQHYGPQGSVLAIVGDIKPADAFARVEKAFGAWQGGKAPTPPPFAVPAADKLRIVAIDMPEAVQTEIRIGQVGIAYTDPDFFKAQVWNSVVGNYATGRLYQEIRRKRGLSYGASSGITERLQPGRFRASTSTKTASTVEALDLMLDVFRGPQKEAVADAEFAPAKAYLTGAFPFEIETPEGIGAMVVDTAVYGLGKDFLDSYRDKLDAVTPAEVQSFAAKRIEPDRMLVVLVGNVKAFAADLEKKHGPFLTLPAAEVDLMSPSLEAAPKAKAAAVAPASAADRARAAELVQKAQAAMGGKAFLEQKSQISRGKGSITPPGAPQAMPVPSLVTYEVKPDKQRMEMAMGPGNVVTAYDGTTGWATMMGQTQDRTAQLKESLSYGVDVLRRAGQPGYTATPLPDADLDGKKAPGVAVADPEGHATELYLDPQSFRVAKVVYTASGQKQEISLSDFREISGVQVPFHRHIVQANGAVTLDIDLDQVEVDTPVDEALFKKPAA